MNKDIVSSANKDNEQALCARIRQDCDEEVLRISNAARAEVERILGAAENESKAGRAAMLLDLDKEMDKAKERMMSMLNLEKKKITLEGRQAFVDLVLAQVRRKTGEFRPGPEYRLFLSRAIVEGVKALEAPQAVVYHADQDAHLFNGQFLSAVTGECSKVLHTQCSLSVSKSDFKDLGVIVQTPDGRMMYDNRFAARMERMYEQIYMELLKEAS